MTQKIIATVVLPILFSLALPIFCTPFSVRFEDDIEFSRGRRSARRLFRVANRYKNLKKLLFWDIRKSVHVVFYTLFWIFLISYVLLVAAMLANIWLNLDWLLFAIRVSAIMGFLSILLTYLSRYELYRGNRIQNRKEYVQTERERLKKALARGKTLPILLTAFGIPLLSVVLTILLWYAKWLNCRG